MTEHKITTVLLDAGGVILDEAEHEKARVRIAVEVLGSVIPGYSLARFYSDVEEAIRVFCPRILACIFWKHLRPNRMLFDNLYNSFLDKWQRRRPPLKLARGLETEVATIAMNLKVGIAGQYGKDMLKVLMEHGILECFTYRFTQDDFDVTKPDPRYLESIAKACGVDPRECIMVGDRVDNDVIPARQLGMKTILIHVGLHRTQQPRTPYEMPDVELDSLSGLAAAVLRLAGIA
jgi:FMN phosphatase YigB (HAD superfamily)